MTNLSERQAELKEHLAREHQQSPFSTYLREIIYGGIDGIVTTFAVVAGFSGAALSGSTTMELTSLVVLLFGMANLFADGVSMGLGNFLSIRSDQSLYTHIRTKEETESVHNGDLEAEETVTILMTKGFSESDARTLTAIYRTNQSYWVDFMMQHELKISNPYEDNALRSGIATFMAFVSFGSIPLIPFMVPGHIEPHRLFIISSVSTGAALVLLGFFKWKVVGTELWRSIGEVVIVGTAAASVAYFVGSLFAL
jgi:VIT1/CCC1 family predicted Fe2+/Mn2+ transporter